MTIDENCKMSTVRSRRVRICAAVLVMSDEKVIHVMRKTAESTFNIHVRSNRTRINDNTDIASKNISMLFASNVFVIPSVSIE